MGDKRCKLFAVTNQKGGVGKSLMAANLGASFAKTGKSVLMIDMDPQYTLAESFAIDVLDPQYNGMSTSTLFRSGIDPLDCIFTVDSVGPSLKLFMIHSTQQLAVTAKRMGVQALSRFQQNIRKIVEEDYFDYIIFDDPPDLGDLLTASLICADEAIIPVKPDKLSMAALDLIIPTIKAIREAPDNQPHNRNLKIAGTIANMYRAVSNEHKRYVRVLENEMSGIPLLGVVPLSTTATKTLDVGLPCVLASPTSAVGKALYNIATILA